MDIRSNVFLTTWPLGDLLRLLAAKMCHPVS